MLTWQSYVYITPLCNTSSCAFCHVDVEFVV